MNGERIIMGEGGGGYEDFWRIVFVFAFSWMCDKGKNEQSQSWYDKIPGSKCYGTAGFDSGYAWHRSIKV